MSLGITLDQASTLVDAALARGGELGLAPLTVAVLDPGGHLVVLKRQDGSGILRAEIAVAKAWGVQLMVDGQLAGAAGISGDTSDNDEACAVHGAHTAGLVPWLE